MKGKTRTSTAGNPTERGFTLIELCVVIVLMGAVLLISAPRIHDSIFNDSLRQTVRQIVAKSRELRSDAIRDNVDYVLHFDMDKSRFWYEASDMSGEKRSEMKGKFVQFPENVKILEVSILGGGSKSQGDATVKIFSRGYTQPAVLYLSQNERVYTIVYNPFSGTASTYDKMIRIDEKTSEFKISLDDAHPGAAAQLAGTAGT